MIMGLLPLSSVSVSHLLDSASEGEHLKYWALASSELLIFGLTGIITAMVDLVETKFGRDSVNTDYKLFFSCISSAVAFVLIISTYGAVSARKKLVESPEFAVETLGYCCLALAVSSWLSAAGVRLSLAASEDRVAK
jgi:hypothetical protein